MKIQVSRIPYEDKTILFNLIQLYRYDSSEYDGHALNKHGSYSYKYLDHQWTEDYQRPLIVKVDGEIAGFVLLILDVPKAYTKLSSAEQTNVVSDFFIMRKFRRKGVGKQVAFTLFEQFPGVWEIKQTVANREAYLFWKHIVEAFIDDGETYHEEFLQDRKWHGPVIVFRT